MAAIVDVGFVVRARQVFVPCRTDAQSALATFIVMEVVDDKVRVVAPFGAGRFHPNGRQMWVNRRSLHPTAKTAGGRERRTGYRLHTDAPSDPHQWLCGSCLRYFDRDDLALVSFGPASSSCRPCHAAIEQQFFGRV